MMPALLPLSETRVRDESRLAAAIAAAHSVHRQRIMRLALLCLAEYALGLTTMGFGLSIDGGDIAQVVFDAGLLVGLCGPVWTVLLSLWLQDNP